MVVPSSSMRAVRNCDCIEIIAPRLRSIVFASSGALPSTHRSRSCIGFSSSESLTAPPTR